MGQRQITVSVEDDRDSLLSISASGVVTELIPEDPTAKPVDRPVFGARILRTADGSQLGNWIVKPPEPLKPTLPTDGVIVQPNENLGQRLREIAAGPLRKAYLFRGQRYQPVNQTLTINNLQVDAWGEGPMPVIAGNGATCLFLWACDNLFFRNIKIDGGRATKEDQAGVDARGCRNIGFADCEITGNRMGITYQPLQARTCSKLSVLRCKIHENSPTRDGVDGSGIFVGGCDGVSIIANWIERNGWSGTYRGSMRNHGVYVRGDCSGAIALSGNLISRSASHGAQMRSGGTVSGNIFVDNPIHLSFGLVNGAGPIIEGGVIGAIVDNYFSGTRPLAGSSRGWAIEVSNTRSVAIDGNSFACKQTTSGGAVVAAIKLDVCNLDESNPQRGKAVGVLSASFGNKNAGEWQPANLWRHPANTQAPSQMPWVNRPADQVQREASTLALAIRENFKE